MNKRQYMFLRYCHSTTCVIFRTYRMGDKSKRTYNMLFEKLSSFERTLTTLQSEVADMKRLLQTTQGNAHTVTPQPKKRKFANREDQDVTDMLSTTDIEGDFKVDENGYVHVYTDGACENNGQKGARAGLGVWFGPNHPLNLAEPVKRRPTNNVGEIEACTRAIQQAHSNGIKKLCINTDSEFTINCITKWIHGWKKRNWINASGKPVINKDELIELDNTLKLMENVKWNHVRGHKGIEGNEAADELARRGATMYSR